MWGSDIVLSTIIFNGFSSRDPNSASGPRVVKSRPVVDLSGSSLQAIRNGACRPPFPISGFISRKICFLLAVIGIWAPPDVGIRIFNTIFYAGENAHILPFL